MRILDPIPHRGCGVPAFLYGTAWKEEATEACVTAALAAGFRGFDTANQRKHYHEAGVGAALARAFAAGIVSRDDLFLQTKFTYAAGQDHRLPYDPAAPVAEQVRQSFESSLAHLGVERLDCLVLHGPSAWPGLEPVDAECYAAMEELVRAGRVALLGVSNVNLAQLRMFLDHSDIPPAFVQNRCFARTGWDAEVRALCRERGVLYQGFSLLTANRRELADPRVGAVVGRTGRALPAVVFRFARQLGMIPLTGSTDPAHLADDLALDDFALTAAEMALVESIGLPEAARG